MFARKSKTSIKQAVALVNQALAIAESYRRDNAYRPNHEDIRQLDALLSALWANHCAVEYISRNLRLRQ